MTERVIRVTIDAGQARRRARGLRDSLRGVAGEGRAANAAAAGLARALRAVGAALSTAAVLRYADGYANLLNRLKLVTEGTENLEAVTSELFDISQRSRTGLEGTVELYSRVARSVDALGVSQRQILDFTEAVNQSIIVSGATAQEAEAGIIQFAQGLASGAIRGEELRSVLEQLPGLAREIAAGLETDIGQLRELGSEGALTAEAVFGAIEKRIPNIQQEFEQLTPTVSQSFTVLQNAAFRFFGELDQGVGITQDLAEFIISAAEGLVQFGEALSDNLSPSDELGDSVQNLAIGFVTLSAAIQGLLSSGSVVAGFFTDIGQAAGGAFAGLTQFLRGNFSEAADIFKEVNLDGFDDTRAGFEDLFNDFIPIIEQASDRISRILLPAFREVRAERNQLAGDDTELNIDLGAAAAAAALQKLAEQRADFIAGLQLEEQALLTAAETGREYADVLEELQLIQELGGDQAFIDAALDQLDVVRALTRAAEERAEAETALADAAADRESLLEDLRLENEALNLATEQAITYSEALEILNIQRAAAGDSEFLTEALALREANEALREGLQNAETAIETFLKRARENSQDILAGFLADPLADGLDELPEKFARVLQELAAQALASEIFALLGGIGAGQGGVLGAIGGFFGGPRASGGPVRGGDAYLVGERGPELFVPQSSGTVVPNQQIGGAMAPQVTVQPAPVVVVDDPERAFQALQSQRGQDYIVDVVRENFDSINRTSQ